MIDSSNDQVTFSFPEVHPDARLVIEFQRTLRIPDADREMPRLPSLGRYPVYSIEEHAQRVPRHWVDCGGAMLPMYQSEAMWLSFRPTYSLAHQAFYPFAVKIRAGGLDALRGAKWIEGLHPWPQDYLVITDHSWLGGFHTGGKGIKQFVAMPLGSGYLPDDGINSPNRFGRLELIAYPMQGEAFAMRYPRNAWQERLPGLDLAIPTELAGNQEQATSQDALQRQRVEEGLFPLRDWNHSQPERYTMHLVNSLHWCAITGSPPPMAPARMSMDSPLTARESNQPVQQYPSAPPRDLQRGVK